jgi:transposase
LTNIHGKLARRGVVVPYRTLHRFAAQRCGFGRRRATVRVADGDPGMECHIDFGRLGVMLDPDTGRGRALHALIFTAVFSRHMFVWLSFTQTLAVVIAGCEAAWLYYGGVFKVLIPDNLKSVVAHADPVNPTFIVGWLDYAQARGFGTDPARVRSPKDKPRVERVVQYVPGKLLPRRDVHRSGRGATPRRGVVPHHRRVADARHDRATTGRTLRRRRAAAAAHAAGHAV